MHTAAAVLQELKKIGVTHVIGLPDNSSAALFTLLESDPDIPLLTVTREGEAFAVAAGLWIGGKTPLVLIQNTGLLESGDSFRGTVIRMRIPLLCLITYRGYAKMLKARVDPRSLPLEGEILSQPDLDSVALMTEPTLAAWGMPFCHASPEETAERIPEAFERALRLSQPMAVLITGDLD